MRNLDPALVAQRGLGAFVYQLVGAGRTAAAGASHAATMLEALRAWGLPVEPHWRACDGIDAVVAFCREWDGRSGTTLEFETDGVVDQGRRPRAARAARRDAKFPRWATAFKFPGAAGDDAAAADRGATSGAPAPSRRTRCSSRCSLAGSTISMATLHNAEDIARKDIRDGDTRAHREGRRRHPEGRRRPCSSLPARPTRRRGRCRRRARRAGARCSATRKRSSGAARTRRARRACAAASSTSPSRTRDEHRGARRVARRSAASSGARPRLRRSLPPRRRTARERSSSRRASRARSGRSAQARQGRRATSSRRSSAARRTTCGALIYALGIRHVGEKAAAHAGAAPSDDGRAASTRRSRRCSGARDRPGRRRVGPGVRSTSRATARSSTAGGGRRATWTSRRRPPARGPGRWPARPSCSPAR